MGDCRQSRTDRARVVFARDEERPDDADGELGEEDANETGRDGIECQSKRSALGGPMSP